MKKFKKWIISFIPFIFVVICVLIGTYGIILIIKDQKNWDEAYTCIKTDMFYFSFAIGINHISFYIGE